MNKLLTFGMLIPVLILIASSTATTVTNHAHASIWGNFGAGYDAGKSAGYNAFYRGSTDATCPYDFGSNISWCTGYHAGFDEEQVALQGAQP